MNIERKEVIKMLNIIEIKYCGEYSKLKEKYERTKNFLAIHSKEETPISCLKGYERREQFVAKLSKLFEKNA